MTKRINQMMLCSVIFFSLICSFLFYMRIEKNTVRKVEQVEEEKGQSQIQMDTKEVIANGQYPIMGKSSVTKDQMIDYFKAHGGSYPSDILGEGGADTLECFVQMYLEEAEIEGVRAEVAFAQSMKETGWLKFGGDAKIEQFNFSGLGTTGNQVAGNAFPDVRTGIRAQIQHLKAYATKEMLSEPCVDLRYHYVVKGSAPYVEWLGQKENPSGYGWATDPHYGDEIVRMIHEMQLLQQLEGETK